MTTPVIRTDNPCTLSTVALAITVCLWGLLRACLADMGHVTRALWGEYRLARAEQSTFDAAHPPPDNIWPCEAERPDDGVLDRIADELGHPAWAWLIVLVCIALIAGIEVAAAWPHITRLLGAA